MSRAVHTPHSTCSFSERAAWRTVEHGWHPLHASFHRSGFSIEWHDFLVERDLDWSPSFHSGGLEVCLNLSGCGEVSTGTRQLVLAPQTVGFYMQEAPSLAGKRIGGERHRFITLEYSHGFLERHVGGSESGLHPALRRFLEGNSVAEVSAPQRLNSEHRHWVSSLRKPPVTDEARPLWYEAKALEIVSTFLYPVRFGENDSDDRKSRQNNERVQAVVTVLKESMAEAPCLKEIGRRVGCSPFHLSRIFSRHMGQSIFQYLRTLRMERAAELLKEGRLNVTEVALEVGYSSPSHFSTTFHETFGCCPGLYPLQTVIQRRETTGRSQSQGGDFLVPASLVS
jgi:AraC-like DNA-binding protein